MDPQLSRVLIAGALVLALVATLLVAPSQQGVYINGERVTDLAISGTGDGMEVPLRETVRLLGGKVVPWGDAVAVRWGNKQYCYIPQTKISSRNSVQHVKLSDLLQEMELNRSHRGGAVYISTRRAELLSVQIADDQLTFRFDRYVPQQVVQREISETQITFYNTAPRNSTYRGGTASPVEVVTLSSEGQGTVGATLRHRQANVTVEKTKETWTDRYYEIVYRVTPLRPEDAEPLEKPESLTPVDTLSYSRHVEVIGGSRHTIHFVRAPNWGENYKLSVGLPLNEVGKKRGLTSIVSSNLGVAGLNANFFDPATGIPIGMIVKDGQLISDNWGRRAVLAVDYFGRLKFLRPRVNLELVTGGNSILVKGINRPLGKNDLVVYTHHWDFAKDSWESDQKTILVVSDGVVREKINSRYRIPHYSDKLFVATGTSRLLIDSLERGDEAKFNWETDPYISMLRDAVSGGPLLIKDGRNALNIPLESFQYGTTLVDSYASRSVVATTWDGDLLFIVVRDSGISLTNLPRLLQSADLNIKSAMALDGGGSAGLSFRDGTGTREIGGSRDIPVALVLVPKY